MPEPLSIWLLTDGKPGHENQTRALAEGIERRTPTVVSSLRAADASRLTARFPRSLVDACPTPDLVLCAGRRTHRVARAVKKTHGGRLVVCMRPSSRPASFDLCLIPLHDAPAAAPNIETTRGAIVNVRPSAARDPARGVILVGGDSKHHRADADAVGDAVGEIVKREDGIVWDLTTSRRTPSDLSARLAALEAANLRVTLAPDTPPGWVRERLATSGSAWVSEDSVSMLCEAVTAGCATGVLPMERTNPNSRVARCVDQFTNELGLAKRFAAWRAGEPLAEPETPLDEADRCAQIILDRFFPKRGGPR